MTSTRIKKTDLAKYNQNENTLAKYSNPLSLVTDVKTTIENICVIHFGIRAGLLDAALMDSIVSTIILKFKSLTTLDLMSSFERIEIKNDSWKNITKRDLIDPIQNWWNKKEEIRLEFERYKAEIEEEKKAEDKIKYFKDLSVCVYNKSLVCNEWLGTVFQANAIYKDVNRQLQTHKKKELWQEAQVQKNKQDAIHQQDPDKLDITNIGFTAKRIYGNLVILEGIKQRIRI